MYSKSLLSNSQAFRKENLKSKLEIREDSNSTIESVEEEDHEPIYRQEANGLSAN